MKRTSVLLFAVLAVAGSVAAAVAKDKPTVAMIGTGTLASTFGPAA